MGAVLRCSLVIVHSLMEMRIGVYAAAMQIGGQVF